MAQSPFMRVLARIVPGVGKVAEQVEPYAEAWADDTRRALAGDGPLLCVLGDSTGQGIGASSHRGGWVGQLHRWIEAETGESWDVANWSASGARIPEVAGDQLDALRASGRQPQLVVVAVGTNDVTWSLRLGGSRRALGELIAALPHPAVIATIPSGGIGFRAKGLNRQIRRQAAEAGVGVADVAGTLSGGAGRLASDGFHPNDRGYAEWFDAFRTPVAEALGLPG